MHNDIEQEGLSQNSSFHDPRGRGSAPRVEPNLANIIFMWKTFFSKIFCNAIDSKLKLNAYLERADSLLPKL
jgi:hypothetical protein